MQVIPTNQDKEDEDNMRIKKMETSISDLKVVRKRYIHIRCKGCESDSSAVINKDGYEAAAWKVGVGTQGKLC